MRGRIHEKHKDACKKLPYDFPSSNLLGRIQYRYQHHTDCRIHPQEYDSTVIHTTLNTIMSASVCVILKYKKKSSIIAIVTIVSRVRPSFPP